MIIPYEIKKSQLYKEMMDLAEQKDILISFIEYSDNSPEGKVVLGFTRYIREAKMIEIGVLSSSLDNETVFIHELLHAKAFLLDYPGIQSYSYLPLHPFMNIIIQSMQNTIHHLFVYKEMKALGKEQEDIDKAFFEFTKRESKKQVEGIGKLAIVFNLLEAHVRDESTAIEIAESIKETHHKELDLYNRTKEVIEDIHSPEKMRKAFVFILKIMNDFVKRETNEEAHLNILIQVDPIFTHDLLCLKASEVLYTIKLQGYPHVFVLDKLDNQCCLCLSLNGNPLDKNDVDTLLNEYSLGEFLNLLKY